MPLFGRGKQNVVAAATGPLAIAKGQNCQLELYENVVRIQRKNGTKDIQISRISSVQLRKPSLCIAGQLEISFSGGQETHGFAGENAVLFQKKQAPAFEAFKHALDVRLN